MILGDALATLELFLHVRNEEVDAWNAWKLEIPSRKMDPLRSFYMEFFGGVMGPV